MPGRHVIKLDWTGPNLDSNWNQIGLKLDPNWNETGLKLDRSWKEAGPKLDQVGPVQSIFYNIPPRKANRNY